MFHLKLQNAASPSDWLYTTGETNFIEIRPVSWSCCDASSHLFEMTRFGDLFSDLWLRLCLIVGVRNSAFIQKVISGSMTFISDHSFETTFIWDYVHLRQRFFETTFIRDYLTWDLVLSKPVHLRPHSNEIFSFETTFIWDHINLRPYSFENTFIWDHSHLRPLSFETTFIWDHIHLRPYSFENTFIWDHIHLRPHSFETWSQMNKRGLKWMRSQMNRSQMNVVSNEKVSCECSLKLTGRKCRGLVWTWSQMKWSQINGLKWTGLNCLHTVISTYDLWL